MDLFQAMTVYVRVVETGSMTAAALQCEMSTTMVGNHLRALEQRLGVRLLNRTTRRQRLTEFGSAYYQRCSKCWGWWPTLNGWRNKPSTSRAVRCASPRR